MIDTMPAFLKTWNKCLKNTAQDSLRFLTNYTLLPVIIVIY